MLGLCEGFMESMCVVCLFLSDFIECGFDVDCVWLWVIDGGKVLCKVIVEIFGVVVLI